MNETITVGSDQALEAADDLLDGLDRFLLQGQFRGSTTRREFAMVAGNIAQDRYSAGSTAARGTLIILLRHGLQAAKDFMADLAHYEH